MIRKRIIALTLCLGMLISLAACTATAPSELSGRLTEYSETVAYAETARGSVALTETKKGHGLTNRIARLDFGPDRDGLAGLTSLQTEEVLLKNTFHTQLQTKDGRTATVTGGTEQVEQGQYGISHRRVNGAVRLTAIPEEAEGLKSYDLTGQEGKDFGILANGVSVTAEESGLTVVSEGGNRAQFGARFLDLDLEDHDHYYLSVTLKSKGISGLRCYFSTDGASLTEDTVLGTLKLSDTEEEITLTAEIGNPHWNGILQTLLFRLPEGETGSVTLRRVAILTADDPRYENLSDTLWTVYSDRMYFSQVLTLDRDLFRSATTVITLDKAKCLGITEGEEAIGLRMIDGSLLGFVRPSRGATLRVEQDEKEIRILAEWDLAEEELLLALPVYLDYHGTEESLNTFAKRERNPLSEEDFSLEGATFDRYDRRGGIYRLTRTGEEISVTLESNDRTVYVHVLPPQNTAWKLCDRDGNRLPVFAGVTFPLRCGSNTLTVRLQTEPAPKAAEIPAFFPESGLRLLSETSTGLNGLCTQQTSVFASADGSYTVTLTATKLTDGTCTIYDVQYDFFGRKQVPDLLTAFPFFSFELTYGFEEYEYLNSENLPATALAGSEKTAYLGSMPYVGLKGDTESAGWIVTKSAYTSEGKPATALQALRYEEVTEHSPNRLYLAFDGGEVTFVQGDTLTAQVIRVEGADAESLSRLQKGGNLQLIQTAHRTDGTVTAAGMEDRVILQIEGYDDYRFPAMTVKGEPFTPDYHVYVDGKGYYGFAFQVPVGTTVTTE